MSKPNAKSAVAQAEADLAAEMAKADAIAKREALKSNALPAIKVMGAEAAKGEGGLTAMAHEFARLVAVKAFDAENADVVYREFVAGYNEEAGTSGLGTDLMSADKDDKSFKNQIRVLADFAKPAVIALCSDPADPDAWHGPAFWSRIVEARSACPDVTLRFGSAYNTMARVARKLQERHESAVEAAQAEAEESKLPVVTPEVEAPSDDDLFAWVRKDASRDPKSLEAKFDAWVKAGLKLVKDLPEGDKDAKSFARKLGELQVEVDTRNLRVRKAANLKANAEA